MEKSLSVLGKNVNRLRQSATLTQEELAEKSDLSRRYIQEIEAGEKSPTIPTLAKIRKALGAEWSDIFRGV